MKKSELTTDEIEQIVECLKARVNSGFISEEKQDRILELLEKLEEQGQQRLID